MLTSFPLAPPAAARLLRLFKEQQAGSRQLHVAARPMPPPAPKPVPPRVHTAAHRFPLPPEVAARLIRLLRERPKPVPPAANLVPAPAPGETLLHVAADAHIAKVKVAIQYAFMRGRAAIEKPALRNAQNKQQILAATSGVRQAVHDALMEVLPKTLLAVLAAGGTAGLDILAKRQRSATNQQGRENKS